MEMPTVPTAMKVSAHTADENGKIGPVLVHFSYLCQFSVRYLTFAIPMNLRRSASVLRTDPNRHGNANSTYRYEGFSTYSRRKREDRPGFGTLFIPMPIFRAVFDPRHSNEFARFGVCTQD